LLYQHRNNKKGRLCTEDAASSEHSSESFFVAVFVVAANDAVLLVVVFQSISKHFQLRSSSAAAVAELGHTPSALHVIAAIYSLNENLRHYNNISIF